MDNRPHRPPGLVQWFYVLLNMRHGWLYGSFIAAGLLTVLLLPYITVLLTAQNEDVVRDGSELRLNGLQFRFAGSNNYYLMYRSQFMVDDVLQPAATTALTARPVTIKAHFLFVDRVMSRSADGSSNSYDPATTWSFLNDDTYTPPAVLYGVVVSSRDTEYRYLSGSDPISQTAQIDAVQIKTPSQAVLKQGDSVQAAIAYDMPRAQLMSWSNNYYRASTISELTAAVQSKTGSSLTTLKELSNQFRLDRPRYIVANLYCSGFEQKPGESQRVLYIGQSLADFRWTILPTVEGPQSCNLMLFLEGVPFGSDTPGQLQIFADTWAIDVKVPPYIFGAPIALYAALYAFLVGAIGALSTKVIPWCYTWVVSRRRRVEKSAKKPVRARAKSTRARRVSR
jgi:hypothetical protein